MLNTDKITVETLRKVCKDKGYNYFEKGSYNLNLIGIRSNERTSNSFDDILSVSYLVEGVWKLHKFAITTDPGLWELQKPSFVNAQQNGTAIMACGQYTGSYAYGYHGTGTWRHKALIQVGAINIYRDKNRDAILDINGQTERGLFGINIHASSLALKQPLVCNWSAGCQVFADPKEYYEFISIIEQAVKIYGPIFTYTLINESDI